MPDGVHPRVAPHERPRRRDHDAVPLAERDGAGGADLLDGQRRDLREARRRRVDLQPKRARQADAERLAERPVGRPHRLDGVRHEHAVRPGRVADEVAAVVAACGLEGACRLEGALDEPAEGRAVGRAPKAAAAAGRLELLQRALVVARVEAAEAPLEAHVRVVRVGDGEAVERPERLLDAKLDEHRGRLLKGPPVGASRDGEGRRRQGGDEQQREREGPHRRSAS